MILESALMCLALNVFSESRGQPLPVQEGVAQVTMTRALYDEKNICKEVLRPKQFSWANKITSGPKEAQMDRILKRIPKPTNKPAYKEWLESKQVAYRTLVGAVNSKVKGASHFYHIKTDNPAWKHRLKYIATIGPFVFLQDTKTYAMNTKMKSNGLIFQDEINHNALEDVLESNITSDGVINAIDDELRNRLNTMAMISTYHPSERRLL